VTADFSTEASIKENVGALDISVCDLGDSVEVCEALDHLRERKDTLGLREGWRSILLQQPVFERPIGHVRVYEARNHIAAVKEELDQSWMLIAPKRRDLQSRGTGWYLAR